MRSGWWQAIGPIHDPAHKATEAMFAYDLVHDTYSPAEHARLREFLRPKLPFLFGLAQINSGNGHPNSNWSAQYRASVAMVALALLADPAPELPAAPGDWDFPKVAPPAYVPISPGTPVLPIDAAPLRKWLYTGPLNIGLQYDLTPALSGQHFKIRVKENPRQDDVPDKYPQAIQFKNARQRPKNHSVTGDDLQPLTVETTVSFKPIPESELIAANEYVERGIGAPGMVHLWRAAGCRSFQTVLFHAIIDNPKSQYVQVRLTSTGSNDDWRYHNSALFISGKKFEQADVLFLEKGRHPVLRQVTTSVLCDAHSRYHLYDEVWLRPLDDATVAKAKKLRNTEVEFSRRAIAAIKPRFEELGRPDVEAMLWLPLARDSMERYVTQAISEGGWHSAGQCYTQHPLLVAMPLLHAWRNATGTDLAAGQNLGWFLGQAAARTVFSQEWACMQDYGRGGGPVGADLFARGFGSVPEKIKADVFAAWRKTLDLTDRKQFKAPEGAVESLDPMSAAFTFVNWPVEGPVAVQLPRALVDTQRLGYTCRNRWLDGDDIVAVFTGFRHPGGDWPCEGAPLDVRLQGLGVEWLMRGNSTVSGMTNRVAVEGYESEPQDVHERHCATSEDGSAVVSLGYTFGKQGKGVRSFAVDYSGSSGAAALLVIADQFQFTPPAKKPTPAKSSGDLADELTTAVKLPNRWRLVTDAGNDVKTGPGQFTITGPNGATLCGTVVAPAKSNPTVQDDTHKIEINYRFDHQAGSFRRKIISVPGHNDYLVVLTLQKGQAPPVRVDRDVVRIGQQTVRFDGERIVLGRFAALKKKQDALDSDRPGQ